MSATFRARDTLRNSSAQLNLRSQHKKAAKKQDGRLYRRTFSLHRVVCRLPGQLRHQVDHPSSRLPHRASLSIRLPGQSRYRPQPSGNYPVYRAVARDCYRHVYRAYRDAVNTNYRADHRASKRNSLIASNSLLPATLAATTTDNATIATSNASPPSLSVTRRHRFRQRHDRYQQRFAATVIVNTSPPPLPATPRSLPATLRRHRYR